MRIVKAPKASPRGSGVSVVIPCYNYGHFLTECVASVLHDNADVPTEVIIVDDASTDGSADVAHSIAARSDRVRFIGHDVNRGHIATYNEGLAMASEEYVVLLSADDMLTPGCLGRAVNLMDSNPELGLVYGRYIPFVTGDSPAPRTRATSGMIWSGPEWIRAVFRSGLNPIASPEAVVRTSVQKQVGGYDLRHPHAGDLHMWLRIAHVSSVGRVNGADQALRRMHSQSMLNTHHSHPMDDLVARRDVFEAFLAESEFLGTREGERLRALLRRRLSQNAVLSARYLDAGKRSRQDDVASLLDLARDIDPAIITRWEWRDFMSTVSATGSRRSRLAGRARRSLRWRWDRRRSAILGV